MKKSEMMYAAQMAVLRDSVLTESKKLEIVLAIEEQRKVEAFWEEKKEKEEAEKAAAEAAQHEEV